jgi:hypothetical protein
MTKNILKGNREKVMTRMTTWYSIKFASLKIQSLFYGDIPDDDPIDSHDEEVGQVRT